MKRYCHHSIGLAKLYTWRVIIDNLNFYADLYTNKLIKKYFGTRFTIDFCEDEHIIREAMLSKDIRMADNRSKTVIRLKTGQLYIIGNEKNIQVTKTHVEDSFAWKNGLTILDAERLREYPSKIKRWYDLKFDTGLYGSTRSSKIIPRDAKLSELFQAIDLKSNVGFHFEGRRDSTML